MSQNTNNEQSTGDQVLNLFSDPFKTEIQSSSIVTAFGLYLGLALALTVLFSLVRPRHRLVYAPKTKHADEAHAPPPIGTGVLSWIKPVTTAKESDLMDRIGLDAVVFLRFTRMLRNIFLAFGIVGLAIMLPVNVSQTKSSNANVGALLYMTPAYSGGNALWAQVVVAYIGNLIVCYFLWHNYRRVHKLRRTYFQSPEYQNSLHARTLIIRDLKADLQSEQGVIRVTDEHNPTGIQPKVTNGRNVKDLPELIEDHEEQVRALESVLAKYLKNPDRLPAKRPTMKPSSKSKYSGAVSNGKVDSIEYLTERIRELEVEIAQVRESVDKRNPMPYAFASWDHIAQAHAVAFANRNKSPLGARLDLAPRPTDLIWKNLSIGKSTRKSRRFVNAIWLSVLTIIWLPLNAAISIFLSNLGNLGAVWGDFQTSLQRNPNWWGIVQAVLAPTIISLVYMILPVIFRRLQIRAGDTTKTEREQHVVRNLYTFFILNNLILFSIFSAVWQYVSTIIASSRKDNTSAWDAITDGQFFLRTMRALCDISAFWVTFLLQRNLGAALDLVQLTRIFVTWFQRKFMSPTPRQNIEWTAPVPFDYASYYNYYLFYATIGMAFANLQPLILLIAAVFFVVESVMKKYLMLYVFVTKNETGGQLWKTLFNRLVFAALLSDVVVAVVLVAKNQWIKTGSLAPLILLLLGFKVYCRKTFDKEIKYYATSGQVDQESLQSGPKQRRRAEKVAVKFGHPALYKPLMTPMVHAKAQHILADVYHGRLNSDAAPLAHGFSDNFAMQPMGATAGKADATAPAPFEFVTEAQQDFAFYKNRDDFREDGGNLYGRPEDTMTERSATPMGFKPGHAAQLSEISAESSRANSPAPLRRKELGNQAQVHPSFRNAYGMDSQASLSHLDTADSRELGLGPRTGPYTDPDDDRTNLLHQNVSMAQFRTGYIPGGTSTAGQEGGYDYFRKG